MHRTVELNQLRAMDRDVIAMEHHAATDVRPLDKVLVDVAESDAYFGLFVWRSRGARRNRQSSNSRKPPESMWMAVSAP
jgi:hypothetical protein